MGGMFTYCVTKEIDKHRVNAGTIEIKDLSIIFNFFSFVFSRRLEAFFLIFFFFFEGEEEEEKKKQYRVPPVFGKLLKNINGKRENNLIWVFFFFFKGISFVYSKEPKQN